MASLTGRVADDSGAVIPGAKIALTGPSGAVKNGVSGNDGSYSFANLPAGEYSVLAAAPELGMAKPLRVTLRPGGNTLDLKLKVTGAAQQITVQADTGPRISTEASNNASALVIRGEDLQALSDDPDDLLADLQALAGPSAGPSGGAMLVDGFSGGELPPKESIREIRINQNPFSPEYDKLGYGRIEIFTKPGTEKFHGTIAYNYANDVWNARNPYAAQKAPLLLNESENSVSGPLTKRASFTFDFERQAVDNGAVINAVTLDPQTLSAVPFTNVSTTPQRRLRISPRVDYQLSENNTLSLRYTFTKTDIRDFGIGGFDLVSRGYHVQSKYNTVQVTETAIAGATVNEVRFQYFRSARQSDANSADAEIQVLGAFTGGGSQTGRFSGTQDNYEFQNYTSILRGSHSWRFGVRLRGTVENNVSQQNFGGTYTFTSIDSYRLTQLGIQQGLSAAQIRAAGGGASQFTIDAGVPGIAVGQMDAGIFAGDDWRVRSNVTVSLGVRYEMQTNIHDHSDFAPRAAFAWAAGKKTVIRGGFGMFYDRFALANTLTAGRYNGMAQQQFVITNPDFYPNIPALSTLNGSQSPQVIQEVSSNLRAPYIMQSAFTVERQLPRNTTFAATYTNSRALHVLRSEDINAPLNGVFPYGKAQPIFEMTSSGVFNQNQLIANVNSKMNAQVSLFGYYLLNRAMSNSDGLGTFPANPYNFAGEYGPAAADVRHRFLMGGSINTKWNIRFSPYVILQSGAPFDITTGSDLYGTTLLNGRPGVARAPGKPGSIPTKYGLLDPTPSAGEAVLPRNYGRGPGLFTVNLRVGKTIGFGPERNSAKPAAAAASGPAPGVNPTAPGGMRGMFSPPTTSHRYNLTFSVSGRNILNHNNPGAIIGNLTSPLFGRANQIAGAPNGEGFSENASNRRLELQMRLSF